MHTAPTKRSLESLSAALPSQAERLFPRFEPMSSRPQGSKLTLVLRLALLQRGAIQELPIPHNKHLEIIAHHVLGH